MKNQLILPFALSTLLTALSGCGGESATIFEDPTTGVKTSTNGCLASADKCLSFVLDYPVEGLNFDCSSDGRNHFVTENINNTVTGGCTVGDKVKFYIQGSQTAHQISLGEVDLNRIRSVRIDQQPAQIGLLDIAAAMTGKPVAQLSMSDDTFRVMVGLVRIFQAVSVAQDAGIEGDIQPIGLTDTLKNDLSKIESSIDVNNLLNGSYVSILKPWMDVSSISEASAQQVAERLIRLANVSNYTTNFLILSTALVDIQGFSGKGVLNTDQEALANMYLLTTREGYTLGYAVQWTGKPVSVQGPVSNFLTKYQLLSQVPPQKLNADAQSGWINPLTKKIESGQPLVLRSAANLADHLNIYQGTLLNGTNIVGTEFMYKNVTGDSRAPADTNIYGRWTQTLNNEEYAGSIDVFRSNPATYLDKQVFRSINTVKTGEQYVFPLYANLIFNFADSTIPSVKLGVVIDENGDIRTNIGANPTATDLSSSQCTNVDPVTYQDTTTGVQQYRIGTTGIATAADRNKLLTIRMILSNPVFGNIDGALVGLNEALVSLPTQLSDNNAGENVVTVGGVRLNLQNLIVDPSTSRGINITGWSGDTSVVAEWTNMHAAYQFSYNTNPDNAAKVSDAQRELAKRQRGTLGIELPGCYSIKTK
ncbi:putative pilus system protein FilF [Acinetobacter sp. WZC-1]|uniref:putative pilus system protein FilF n=1 Tax=Acinetobacter sp. WZC-1 TaxID=3459034 RepID=UPI00403E049A